jgi:cell division protein FtsQ
VTAPTRSRRSTVVPAQDRLDERAAQERAHSRRGWLRRLLVALAVLVLGAGAGWVLLVSTWLAVDEVTVVGTSRLSADEVARAADVRVGVPLARLDLSAVEDRVRALAPVAEVSAVRSWPGTVLLEVSERVPVAAHVGRDGVRLLDATGVAFATVPEVPAGLLRVDVDRPARGDAATTAALRVAADLPPDLRARVAGVGAASSSTVTLALVDGRTVVWGSPGDTPTKAAAVLAMLPMEGTTFDVSAPGVAVRR